MGFTDETVRFNLNDGDKNEISNTLTMSTVRWLRKVIILSTKSLVMF